MAAKNVDYNHYKNFQYIVSMGKSDNTYDLGSFLLKTFFFRGLHPQGTDEMRQYLIGSYLLRLYRVLSTILSSFLSEQVNFNGLHCHTVPNFLISTYMETHRTLTRYVHTKICS